MGMFAFRRLREQEAASKEAASLSIAEPTLIPTEPTMAITIVATPNAANANSYLTLADAQAIIDGFVQDADVQRGRLLPLTKEPCFVYRYSTAWIVSGTLVLVLLIRNHCSGRVLVCAT
jgi:hypothetical protein